jgi:hypothetical protein
VIHKVCRTHSNISCVDDSRACEPCSMLHAKSIQRL